MPEDDDAKRTTLARQQIGESLGLLILAADMLGLPQTKAALNLALRRLDREAAPSPRPISPRPISPGPDSCPDAAAPRSAPAPAAPAPSRHPR